MNNVSNETAKMINLSINRYFKNNGISQSLAAEMLGYTSRNAVSNQLSYGRFGKNAARRWSIVFGFNEEFLKTGKGELIEHPNRYSKIIAENKRLKAIIRIKKTIITKMKATCSQSNISFN